MAYSAKQPESKENRICKKGKKNWNKNKQTNIRHRIRIRINSAKSTCKRVKHQLSVISVIFHSVTDPFTFSYILEIISKT